MPTIIRGFLLTLVLIFAPASVLAADQDKPSFVVVLERETILANQTVVGHVWIENPTKAAISRLTLTLQGPTFLSLGQSDGRGRCDTSKPVELPLVVAASGAAPPLPICVKASDSVLEEDINLAFSLGYAQGQPSTREGFIVVEKKLKVGLLGTDSIAGISLRLIGFFLPGALALMLLRLFKVAWVASLSSTEAAILAIIISTLLSLPALWFGPQRFWPSLPGQSGVSSALLLATCTAAIGAVMAILLIRWLWGVGAKAYHERLLVADGDDDKSALRKALQSAGGDFRSVRVKAGDKEYVGSAVASRRGGGLVVFGWFKIDAANAKTRASLLNLLAENKYVEALRLSGVEVSTSSTIRQGSGESLNNTNNLRMVLVAEAKAECDRGEFPGSNFLDPPLMIKS